VSLLKETAGTALPGAQAPRISSTEQLPQTGLHQTSACCILAGVEGLKQRAHRPTCCTVGLKPSNLLLNASCDLKVRQVLAWHAPGEHTAASKEPGQPPELWQQQ